MIEPLLQAEQALLVGMLDRADQLYWQVVERDPKNSIAVVGLAKVALERGDELTALEFARLALQVDAENVAAQRLEERLTEVLEHRGTPIPPWPGGRVVDYPRSGSATAAAPTGATGAGGSGVPSGAAPASTPESSGAAAAAGSSPSTVAGADTPGGGDAQAASGASRPADATERRGLFRRLIRRR